MDAAALNRGNPWRAACKPSSVPAQRRRRTEDGHPSGRPTRGLSEPPAATLTPPFALLFGLAPARACRVSLPLARASSLWRWSSPHGGRALPASLLYGARTFLERRLSTIASAAVWPPPGTTIVAESNACSADPGVPRGSPRARSGTPSPNSLDGDRDERRAEDDGTDIGVAARPRPAQLIGHIAESAAAGRLRVDQPHAHPGSHDAPRRGQRRADGHRLGDRSGNQERDRNHHRADDEQPHVEPVRVGSAVIDHPHNHA